MLQAFWMHILHGAQSGRGLSYRPKIIFTICNTQGYTILYFVTYNYSTACFHLLHFAIILYIP
jgi:hypothetical protein